MSNAIRTVLKKKGSSKDMKSSTVARQSSRSFYGNVVLFTFLFVLGFLFFFPVLYMLNQSVKPLNEMYMFPPRLFVQNPTWNNFRDLFRVLANTLVPFVRYLFNSLFVVALGALGHMVFAAMCAYPLAKYEFPGSKWVNNLIVYSLMFNGTVTMVPNFITISRLNLIDTYGAIIFPTFASTLGLYLMKNFMEQIPDSLLEAAKLDGATQPVILVRVVMPLVKPAWATAFILIFQNLWTNTGDKYIYSESLKSMGYLLTQLVSSSTVSSVSSVSSVRAGVLAAASAIMFMIPAVIFLLMQTNVISTMATSGMKE